jgi:HK97 family phage prohead protease
MSELTLEQTQDIEAPETGLLRREFSASVTAGTGRTVDVLVVPYGEQIEHNDGHGGVPKGVVYREEWSPGAFDHQLSAANRILANCEHERGISGVVGHGIALVSRQDGLYGSFKIHETPVGETALTLIREGVFNSVSLEAVPRKAVRTVDGVIRRTKADLRGVSFSRFGAYASAKVLAVREQADSLVDEALLPVDIDPELVERCRRLGISLPQRYEAHPATTDTPAEAGTSEASAPAATDNFENEEQD